MAVGPGHLYRSARHSHRLRAAKTHDSVNSGEPKAGVGALGRHTESTAHPNEEMFEHPLKRDEED
jgi:hypothetical protein